jgi:hypothetical protein
MMKTSKLLCSALLATGLVFTGLSQAQLVSGMTLASPQAKVGEPVKATVNFDVPNGLNCGMHVHWGDGTSDTFKINQEKDVPLQATHSYAKPGSYKIKAEPKRVGTSLKCGGDNQEATVVVAAPAATKTAAVTAGVCPVGWKLAAPGVNKKSQAFTCTAPANSSLPQAKVSCPGELTYFENAKKGQLGCRP